MVRPLLLSLCVTVLSLALITSAEAQFQQQLGGTTTGFPTAAASGSTSQSMFGTRTQGSGIRSNGSASSFGNSGQNSGAFAQGQTSSNRQAGTSATGNANQQPGSGVQGNERFTREGRQPGAFVGADSGDTTNIFSQQGADLGGMQGLNLGLQNQNQLNNQLNNLNNGQNNRPKVRTGLRVAPEFKAEIAQKLTNPASIGRVQTRLDRTPQFQRLGSVNFAVEGRTAVLRGTVATNHARDLAARVALLEPGISAVQNELVVGPVESKVSTPESK